MHFLNAEANCQTKNSQNKNKINEIISAVELFNIFLRRIELWTSDLECEVTVPGLRQIQLHFIAREI